MDRPPCQPPEPDRPLDFEPRDGRLHVTLGARRLDAGALDPTLGETLVAGLEAVLKTRDWPTGQHRLHLDRAGTRRLGVRHRPEGLELSLLDAHDRPVSGPVPLPLAGFARAVEAFVAEHAPADAGTRALRRALADLVGWAEALDVGDRRPRRPTPAAWPPPAEHDPPDAEPLPVGRLRHLAYRRAWRHEAPGLSRVAAAGDRLAVFDADGLVLLDRETGRIRCRRAGLRPIDGPAPMRFAVDPDGAPVALTADGALRWRGRPPESDAPLHALHPAGDRVLALTAGRDVYGLGAADGRTAWRYATHYGEVVGAAVHGPVAWLAAEDGFVHALELDCGSPRFVVAPGGELEGPPRLVSDGLLVGARRPPDPRSRVICLDPLDGHLRWSAALDGHLAAPLRAAGDAVIALVDGGDDPEAVSLDARTGALRWRRPLDGIDDLCGPPAVRAIDGALYLKYIDGSVVALDPDSGALRWLLPGDDPELTLRTNPPPAPCRGLILVPGTMIRAVDPADGRLVHVVDCDELVPDWLHVWPEGDLAVAEHDAVARYLLGGHLALIE